MSSPAHFDRHESPPFARDSHGVLVRRFHSDGGPPATLAVVGLVSILLAG
jgi:hypothetical protein